MLNAVPARALERDLPPLDTLVDEVETVFRGKREVVRLSLAALLARGHLLFEDIPGVGKTTLARALTAALGLEFRRVQFTSDLLPSDVLGVSVYNPREHTFEIRRGPVFTNVVLADEINRAPPRTQSGLLEAMQEGRVTIDERSFDLPRPFLVMATQNPLEQHGTYPLPESQLDRFMMRLSIGYPDALEERQVLLHSGGTRDAVGEMRPVLDAEGVLALQARVDGVHADASIVEYLMALVQATRAEPRFRAGASTRAAISLLHAARGYALVDGREFLVPDDIRRLAVPVLAHRLIPIGASGATADAYEEAVALLEGLLERLEIPV
jgi:MoxR-like ATPase